MVLPFSMQRSVAPLPDASLHAQGTSQKTFRHLGCSKTGSLEVESRDVIGRFTPTAFETFVMPTALSLLRSCLLPLFLCALTAPLFAWAEDPKPQDNPPVEEKPAEPTFPDPGLEEAVRAEVFEKRYNKEPITKEDVANISRVVGRGKQIKNLEGLQHCKALMLIELADNEISDLKPIAELKRLQSVTLAGNKISDITPLENLTSMQLLDLSGNEVADLSALKKMANLRTLYVASNKLKSLEPLAELTKIWSLDVAKNEISDLTPVAKLAWLSTLNISENQVESLAPLTTLRELDMLLMSKNKVADLEPLVEMCRKDAEGDRRFAPYMEVYLGGNPLDEKKAAEQTQALQSFGVDVYDK
jgi:internalin A